MSRVSILLRRRRADLLWIDGIATLIEGELETFDGHYRCGRYILFLDTKSTCRVCWQALE
jgi:hypothetical protein